MKIFLLFTLFTCLVFPFSSQANEDTENKIRQLLIVLPNYQIKNNELFILPDMNSNYGGFIINAWEQNKITMTTDLQAACKLKKAQPNAIIFTDQEGGFTRRYKDLDMISAHKAHKLSPEEYKNHILEYSKILKQRCIDVNLAPVINVSRKTPVPYSHPRKIDEKRSYSANPKTVKKYSQAFTDGSYEAGVIPTAKHFPGDIIIDKIAFDSNYINKSKGHRWEINNISTDYPLEENIDMFFFDKPQFIMWSSNIFKKYSDKPAFMVDEFNNWIKEKKCSCLLISDALNELNQTDEVILKSFTNSDMIMMYNKSDEFIQKISDFIKEGKISEKELDQKIQKIQKFKEKKKSYFENNV